MKKIRINKKIVGYTFFALTMVAFFLYLRFPDRVVGNYLLTVLEERFPAALVSFESLSLGIPPGLKLKNVVITYKAAQEATARIDQFAVRPRLLPYLAARSSFAVRALAYGGSLQGVINYPDIFPKKVPSTAAITIDNVSLDKISYLRDNLGRQITGSFSGSYKFNGDSQMDFTIKKGTYQLLESVFGFQRVDFNTIDGKFILKNNVLKITNLTLNGDKVNYSVKGDILLNSNLKNSEVNLSGSMVIASLNNKKVSLQLTGTLGNIVTRYL